MADYFKKNTKEDIKEFKEIVSNEAPVTKYHLFTIDHEMLFMENYTR